VCLLSASRERTAGAHGDVNSTLSGAHYCEIGRHPAPSIQNDCHVGLRCGLCGAVSATVCRTPMLSVHRSNILNVYKKTEKVRDQLQQPPVPEVHTFYNCTHFLSGVKAVGGNGDVLARDSPV
jgi:hypothetical protein